MRKINVSDELYTAPDVQEETKRGWRPAKPELYSPNIWEYIKHSLGIHWSYGQPYCVVCGKKEKKL